MLYVERSNRIEHLFEGVSDGAELVVQIECELRLTEARDVSYESFCLADPLVTHGLGESADDVRRQGHHQGV